MCHTFSQTISGHGDMDEQTPPYGTCIPAADEFTVGWGFRAVQYVVVLNWDLGRFLANSLRESDSDAVVRQAAGTLTRA